MCSGSSKRTKTVKKNKKKILKNHFALNNAVKLEIHILQRVIDLQNRDQICDRQRYGQTIYFFVYNG